MHLVHPGGRPSSLIVLPRLEAYTLGALLALYEHKVFSQGVIWGINPSTNGAWNSARRWLAASSANWTRRRPRPSSKILHPLLDRRDRAALLTRRCP